MTAYDHQPRITLTFDNLPMILADRDSAHRIEADAVSTEINLKWASENPDLFVKTVSNFYRDREGWGLKVDTSRDGFITLAARRDPIPDPEPMTQEQRKAALISAAGDYLRAKGRDVDERNFRKEMLTKALALLGREKVADVSLPFEMARIEALFR